MSCRRLEKKEVIVTMDAVKDEMKSRHEVGFDRPGEFAKARLKRIPDLVS